MGDDPERGSGVRTPASTRLIDSVLVTGGTRGIGRAIALRFAARGAKRIAIGYLRNDRVAEETAEELRAAGAEPILVRGNVTSERVLEEVASLGPLDVVVHNVALTTDNVTELVGQVVLDDQDIATVAQRFLHANGLL